ncbi:hypothetical protein AB0L25_40785 [Spirillospora sp. NPDC052242]
MTSLARRHLTELRRTLNAPDINAQARHPAIPAEISRLTAVLARYHDRIATGFGVPHPDEQGVRDAARRSAALLREAQLALGAPAATEMPATELAGTLRSVSVALGCGLDLLASHFPTTPDQPASDNATVINATDTARSLMDDLAEYTATCAHLAQQTATSTAETTGPLLRAAVISRVFGQHNIELASGVPFRTTPERIPPQPGEGFIELLNGIHASVQRLKDPQTPACVATWRYLATAAAVTSDINHKLILSLARRLQELHEDDPQTKFKETAMAVNRTRLKWRFVVKHWNRLPGYFGPPESAISIDASDLIVRLGRLVYSDPDWRPSPRSSYLIRPLDELAPTSAQAAEIAVASLKALDACNTIAHHRRAASRDAAVIIAIEKDNLNHPRYPHSPKWHNRAINLHNRYEVAESEGRNAAALLRNAIQVIHTNQRTTGQDLIAHRQATAPLEDFPDSITKHLAAKPPHNRSSSRKPSGHAPGPNRSTHSR